LNYPEFGDIKSCEMSVTNYQSTRRHNPDEFDLHNETPVTIKECIYFRRLRLRKRSWKIP